MSSAQKRPRRRLVVHQAVKRSDDADAFIPDPDGGPAVIDDDLAQSLAEDFIENATTGQSIEEEVVDAEVSEEIGGPFVETSAAEELAHGADASNPAGTIPEPVPRAVAGIVALPAVEEPSDGHDGGGGDGDGEDRDAAAADGDPDIRAQAPQPERDLDALNAQTGRRPSSTR